MKSYIGLYLYLYLLLQTDVMGTGSGLDLAYYSLNGTPDHQPVPHRLLASSMGRSLDEAFVTSSYCDYSEYSGEPLTARVTHHRTSSQPSRLVTTYRAVDNGQGNQPCGGSMMDFDPQPAAGMYPLCLGMKSRSKFLQILQTSLQNSAAYRRKFSTCSN